MRPRSIHWVVATLTLVLVSFSGSVVPAVALLGVLPPPDVLQVNDDFATTNEDTEVAINVLANDNYGINNVVDVGLFRVSSVTTPSNGFAVINGDDTVTYTPESNFFGSDSFRYTVSDAAGLLEGTATVHVTVDPVNDPPVANDDSATTKEDSSVSISVLANDSDADGDALTIISVTQGNNGVSELFSNFVIYTPNRDFNGQDSLAYTISDGNGGAATATVHITVTPVRDFTVNKVGSGLVASDPLTEPKTKEQLRSDSYWRFGGSAEGQNAPVDFFQDAEGLHIGVQAATNGTYAGFYALTPPTNAPLFHAVITTPLRSIPSGFFANDLYVQTANGLINYVTCVAITSRAGTIWHIMYSSGDTVQTTNNTVLWTDTSPNQPLTRDCTIITNGNNYLKVYLDNTLVYGSSQLNLKMPAPFLYFLEPQNPNSGQMLYGIYNDFYIASDENIKVINAPATAARVDLVDSSGNVLATAPVISGTATLDVGKHHFPLATSIKVYDGDNAEIASTPAPASTVGGDVYSVDNV